LDRHRKETKGEVRLGTLEKDGAPGAEALVERTVVIEARESLKGIVLAVMPTPPKTILPSL
jgi:hypothetical protein